MRKKALFYENHTRQTSYMCRLSTDKKYKNKHILRPIEKDAMSQRQPDMEHRLNSRQLLSV